ncbi:MAG: hypothetical protein VX464_11685 [Pseudomonadota bacterium]|nr:hypothetical protein [Pseudomonadota bacterium]
MTTFLQICQAVASDVGFPRPATVIGASDETAIRLAAVADREGRALARRYAWQSLTKEGTFLAQAQENQGTWGSLGSGSADYSDLDRLIPNTFWDRTENIKVFGPLDPQEYQALKSATTSGPYWSFRIRGDSVLSYPNPTAGNTVAFEYISKYWVDTDGDGVGEADSWQADTNTPILNDELLILGMTWRFKKSIGEDYQEDFQVYEQEVANAMARSGSARTLDLSGSGATFRAGIFAPEGNWSP